VVTGSLNDSVETVVAKARRTFGLVVVISCMRGGDKPPAWAIVYDQGTDLAGEWRAVVTSAKGTLEA
jgi:hypothetical protein